MNNEQLEPLRQISENITKQRVFFANHTPSWSRPGANDGSAELNMSSCKCKWLDVSIGEYGAKSSKTTNVVLHSKESIRALRDMCNRALDE